MICNFMIFSESIGSGASLSANPSETAVTHKVTAVLFLYSDKTPTIPGTHSDLRRRRITIIYNSLRYISRDFMSDETMTYTAQQV